MRLLTTFALSLSSSTSRCLSHSLTLPPLSSTSLSASMSTFASASKKARITPSHPTSSLTIGTHSGTFQADEATGVWLLRQLPQYSNSPVVRSRDLEVLAPLPIVIDVGGEYDHTKKRYDHHMRTFDTKFPGSAVTKLSAAGLVYLHYGRDVITQFYPYLADEPEKLEVVYEKLYVGFMLPIDAIDNGVEAAEEVKYRDNTGLAARVGKLNKRWNEDGGETEDEVSFGLGWTLVNEQSRISLRNCATLPLLLSACRWGWTHNGVDRVTHAKAILDSALFREEGRGEA